MRVFNSSLAASLKKIKKTHKLTKGISWIYALGIIILTALAFLPTLHIQFAGEGKLFIGNFFKPLLQFFGKKTDVVGLIIMVLYLTMIVLLVINMFRCLSKFGKILRRTSGNVTTCNKNLAILEEIGEIYSVSLAIYIIFNLVIYMMSDVVDSLPIVGVVDGLPAVGVMTLFGAIALVLSLVVHFWAAVLTAKVSVFIIGATIEEKKREEKIMPFFLRNLVQVIGIIGVLIFFTDASNVYIELANIFKKGETSAFTNIGGDLFAFIAVVLQLVVVAVVAVLIVHATALTEYNRIGMDGPGMYNYRVFGIITAVLCLALFFLDTVDGMLFNYIFAALIAGGAVAGDFLLEPREKKVKVVEEDPMLQKYQENYEPEKKEEEEKQQQPQFPAQAANCCLYSRPCYPTGIPPYEQAAMEQSLKEESDNEDSTEENNQTSSIYYTMVNGRLMPVTLKGEENVGSLPETMPPQLAPTVLNVICPSCGKALAVKDTSEFHRCPGCGKVFQIRTGKKMSTNQEPVWDMDELAELDGVSATEGETENQDSPAENE